MSLTSDSLVKCSALAIMTGGSLLVRRVSCLAVDSPNKVKDILLITAYWVLIVSYVLHVVR